MDLSFAHVRSRNLLAAAVCALLCACAPAGVKQDGVTAAPEPGVAIVIGWGHSTAENARAAAVAEKGTRVTRLYVAHYEGRKISFGENVARVPPGERDLVLTCGIYIDYRFFTYDSPVRVKLEANHVYRLRANPEGRRCNAELEDVTGRNG